MQLPSKCRVSIYYDTNNQTRCKSVQTPFHYGTCIEFG